MSLEIAERTAHLEGYLRRLDKMLEIMGTRELRAYDVNASLNLLASAVQELVFMVKDNDREIRRILAKDGPSAAGGE